jgi:hypothetical protein
MRKFRFAAMGLGVAISLATLLCGPAHAQTAKAEGLITGRSGDTMTLQKQDSSNVVVVLTDDTQVAQVQGVLRRDASKCPWPL